MQRPMDWILETRLLAWYIALRLSEGQRSVHLVEIHVELRPDFRDRPGYCRVLWLRMQTNNVFR